jgi:hypothetical protein
MRLSWRPTQIGSNPKTKYRRGQLFGQLDHDGLVVSQVIILTEHVEMHPLTSPR